MFLLVTVFVFAVSGSGVSAQLSATFYSTSCPDALSIIQSEVNTAVSVESRMGASLLRLHFHDCFVNGCDASVLLDDTTDFTGEKTAFQNSGLRGFEVIDKIKIQLETTCPRVVSCADILAVAARDSVVALGGQSWSVLLGRRDATTASLDAATTNLPQAGASLSDLLKLFSDKGFDATEMVALSGSHTIGQARCVTFRNRIYNDANIEATFATSLQANCPTSGGDENLAPLDDASNAFDNNYFSNLQIQKGLLHSDQELFNGGSTDSIVSSYVTNSTAFLTDFANAMVKMGNLGPLTFPDGENRGNCRTTN